MIVRIWAVYRSAERTGRNIPQALLRVRKVLHFIDRQWRRSGLERFFPGETQQHTQPVRFAGDDKTHCPDGNGGHADNDSPTEELRRIFDLGRRSDQERENKQERHRSEQDGNNLWPVGAEKARYEHTGSRYADNPKCVFDRRHRFCRIVQNIQEICRNIANPERAFV